MGNRFQVADRLAGGARFVRADDRVPIVGGMPPGGRRACGPGEDAPVSAFGEDTHTGHVTHDNAGVAGQGRHRTVCGRRD